MHSKHRLSTIFSFFFDPKIPLLFLIGTFVTAVGGNAAFSFILKAIGGDSSENYLRILIGSILVLIFIVVVIKVVLSKFAEQGSVEPSPAFEILRKGVIYTAGKQTDTIRFSLDNQKPQYIGFLCSKMSESYVEELMRAMGFDENNYQLKPVDPQNVVENRTETQLLVSWMLSIGLRSSDIVIDVTGGMTTMSVGAFSMADELKIDTQYIKSDFDENNKPIKNTQRGVFVKRFSGSI
jgi:hypothetical protein